VQLVDLARVDRQRRVVERARLALRHVEGVGDVVDQVLDPLQPERAVEHDPREAHRGVGPSSQQLVEPHRLERRDALRSVFVSVAAACAMRIAAQHQARELVERRIVADSASAWNPASSRTRCRSRRSASTRPRLAFVATSRPSFVRSSRTQAPRFGVGQLQHLGELPREPRIQRVDQRRIRARPVARVGLLSWPCALPSYAAAKRRTLPRRCPTWKA
jgi:hypothetical protein